MNKSEKVNYSEDFRLDHIEKIEIVEYKCFKNFDIDGMKKINIISGSNNVGKTVLLEALLIERTSSLISNIFHFIYSTLKTISYNRSVLNENFLNYMEEVNFESISNEERISLKFKNKRELSDIEYKLIHKSELNNNKFIVYNKNNEIEIFSVDSFNGYTDILVPHYINSSKPTTKELVNLYSYIQDKNIQNKFLDYIHILDKNISLIEPKLVNGEMILNVTINSKSYKSSELGEGLSRYIEILTALLGNENGSVFIDEIENGIHYSKLLDIAKAIIEIVKKEGIQLFLTTHDKETVEAFANASKEVGFKDISSIKLIKDEDNKIVPIVRQYDNFTYGIERGADMR